MDDLRLSEAEQEIRDLNRTLAGQRHWLKVAAEYKNDDPIQLIAGVQAALSKAAEYEPRTRRRERNGRSRTA